MFIIFLGRTNQINEQKIASSSISGKGAIFSWKCKPLSLQPNDFLGHIL